jgi:large subunit ribosomal protein L2
MREFAPTSPGRRHYEVPDYSTLTKAEPWKPLLVPLKKHAGRNSAGRITVRHRGGGSKRLLRIIDFGEAHLGSTGVVETIEYDPNRTAFIARVSWRDGSRSYVLAPQGLQVGQTITCAESAPIAPGNRMRLKNIPVGTLVHNVEVQPGAGGRFARSAGSSAEVLAHEGIYTHLRMPSGEIRKVLSEGFASIGQLSNPEHHLVSWGKAGRSRGRGIRPTVRGSAMNPRDHPYGGGEGRQPRGTRKPKTKWGKVTGGRKTRKKRKWSNVLIISRRVKK